MNKRGFGIITLIVVGIVAFGVGVFAFGSNGLLLAPSPELPDLTIESIEYNIKEIDPNRYLARVDFRVTNIGDLRAQSSITRTRFCTSWFSGGGGCDFVDMETPSLAAGEGWNGFVEREVVGERNHLFVIDADANLDIEEIYELNNHGEIRFST